ncbi:TetR/AcrR family transcriptional regulator [Hymenobacter sp. GOD-10R]|uniref:TetR/AcrR family transcriptional regulator n=1 Tax=Hymenobacter sp. GOD-10R TaxID=3093922 RepID=UPI002D7827C8|nr:TetR family transcriptional regulator [Hymenobacter sp. GOD-10R]WRQ30859.1 TetR family transcriptional regulator [Hymenobacter sp. GOD-10R]
MSEETAPQNTEKRIKEAARKVFMEKGFDGTTTRDIAEAAGINVALTNYYFRSKEKLFRMIFEDAHRDFFHESHELLQKPISLREKIPQLIASDFRLFAKNPNLSLFLITERHRHPELLASAKEAPPAVLFFLDQVQEAVTQGEIRPVAPAHVLQLIMANVQFVYLSKPIMFQCANIASAAYGEFIANHQQLVTQMIMTYLFDF